MHDYRITQQFLDLVMILMTEVLGGGFAPLTDHYGPKT